jgi:hypothetical protein
MSAISDPLDKTQASARSSIPRPQERPVQAIGSTRLTCSLLCSSPRTRAAICLASSDVRGAFTWNGTSQSLT